MSIFFRIALVVLLGDFSRGYARKTSSVIQHGQKSENSSETMQSFRPRKTSSVIQQRQKFENSSKTMQSFRPRKTSSVIQHGQKFENSSETMQSFRPTETSSVIHHGQKLENSSETMQSFQPCNFVLTDPSGVISSPNFPDPYGYNFTCVWNIEVSGNQSIELFFHYFSLPAPENGECYDSVKVYDGTTDDASLLTDPFCDDGPMWPRFPTRLLSSTGHMKIILESDMSITGDGFNATYTAVPPRTDVIFGVDIVNAVIVRYDRLSNMGVKSTPLMGVTHPSALSYDPVEDTFYYTNVDPEQTLIGRIKQDGSQSSILIQDELGEPLGIAVAYRTGLLYWTDVSRNEVTVSKLDGTNRRTIVSSTSGCTSPRGIVLDANQEYVYWTCKNMIQRSRADGSSQEIFVGNMRHPTAIAIDSEEGVLYFTDIGRGSLERVTLDGKNRMTVVTSPTAFQSIYDFVLDQFAFIWSDPAPYQKKPRLFLILRNVNPPVQWDLTRNPPVKIKGLFYFNSAEVDLEDLHQCRINNSECGGICFPGNSNSTGCDEVSSTIPTSTDSSTTSVSPFTEFTTITTAKTPPAVIPLALIFGGVIGVMILASFVVTVTVYFCVCRKSNDQSRDEESAPQKGYGQFCEELASSLDESTMTTLATVFGFTNEEYDELKKDQTPASMFVRRMTDKGLISPGNITVLMDALKTNNREDIAKQVQTSFDKNVKGYGQFCEELASSLDESTVTTLATVFGFTNKEHDEFKRDRTPTNTFVRRMTDKGLISPCSITVLTDALKANNREGMAKQVQTSFDRNVKGTKPGGTIHGNCSYLTKKKFDLLKRKGDQKKFKEMNEEAHEECEEMLSKCANK